MNVMSGGNVHLETALLALRVGLSPIPPAEDGSKEPIAHKASWKQYQTEPATEGQIRRWYANGRTGNGLACGVGGLECFEFDHPGTYKDFLEAAWATDLGELVDKIRAGYEESTPGGGFHWLYRTDKGDGNTPLARRYKTPDEFNDKDRKAIAENPDHKPVKVLIETRGEGGFIVTAPSNGLVHPTGGAYKLLSGSLESIVTLTSEERDALWNLAKTFDEMPGASSPTLAETEFKKQAPRKGSSKFPDQVVSPWDDYNQRENTVALLQTFGWTVSHVRNGVHYLRRPGKDRGWSATYGYCKGLKVFTSSTSLPIEGTHSPFSIITYLKFNGDFKAATKALAENGYGTWCDNDGGEKQNPPPKDWKRKAPATATGGKPNFGVEGPLIVRGSAIKPKTIEWLEPGVIAVGFIGLFAGKTGIGKSLVACALIKVMLERGIIDGVLWIGEDPPDKMTIPRLIGMGIDTDKFVFLTDNASDVYVLKNLAMLNQVWLDARKPKLVVIDPPANWLGGIDPNSDAAVRSILRPIITWLNQNGVACVLIGHTRKKRKGGECEAIDEVAGSFGWGTACRMMTIFTPARDALNPKLSLMTFPKMNLGETPKTRTYEIVAPNGSPIIQWHENSQHNGVTADEAINRPITINATRGQSAVAWLEERFRERPSWASDELKTAAKAAGLSKNALWSDEVKALPIKKELSNGVGTPWLWKAIPPWPGQPWLGEAKKPLSHPYARPERDSQAEDWSPELRAAVRWLSAMVRQDQVPRASVIKLGDSFFFDESLLDQAASILNVERSFEEGNELWRIP